MIFIVMVTDGAEPQPDTAVMTRISRHDGRSRCRLRRQIGSREGKPDEEFDVTTTS